MGNRHIPSCNSYFLIIQIVNSLGHIILSPGSHPGNKVGVLFCEFYVRIGV